MYLSKITLPWYGQVDYYQIHKNLWTLFPDRQDEDRKFLFRIERRIPRYGVEILLQSLFQPANYSTELKIEKMKEFFPVISEGDRLRFRLLGNPVKTIKDEKGRKNSFGKIKSCRVPLISVDEQKAWFERKLIDAAVLENVSINGAEPILFYKKKEKCRGKIQPVLYDGMLIVKNGKSLLDILETGIGPAKAFGCGLLSLARG